MKPHFRYTSLMLIALILAGCGSLKVQVDVVDPEYVQADLAEGSQRALARRIIQAQPGDFKKEISEQFASFKTEVIQLAKSYDTWFESTSSTCSALKKIADGYRLAVETGRLLDKEQVQVGSNLESKAQEIRKEAGDLNWNGRGAIPADIRKLLLSFNAEYKELSFKWQKNTRELAKDRQNVKDTCEPKVSAQGSNSASVSLSSSASKSAEAEILKRETQLQSELGKSIIAGAELSNTEYAYVVANAPEGVWHPKYNEACGIGLFGNVDVILRMNSTADFSVKGMRFDASTVAQVASKVTTQALLLGAQMAGVPVPTASAGTQTGADALSKQSATLAAQQQLLEGRKATIEGQHKAIKAAASMILSVSPQLETTLKGMKSDDSKRKALHSAVQSTIVSLKPLLQMQELK